MTAMELGRASACDFAESEYDMRAEKARRLMAEHGLAVLLLTGEADFRYFAGFHTETWASPTRPRFLVLPADGELVAVVPASNLLAMRQAGVVDDVRTWNAPNPADEGVSLLADVIRQACPHGGALGVEMGPETRIAMPLADVLRLRELVAPLSFCDSSVVIREVRRIKSSAEIANIRTVARIVSDGFEALSTKFRVGMSEHEVGALLKADILSRGADKTPFMAVESGRSGYDKIITGPSHRRLEPGDLLFIDTGSTLNGYWCDFDRHFAVGHLADEARHAHELVYLATEAGLNAVRPGTRTCDVWSAMAAVMSESGTTGSVVGRMGHGLGLIPTGPPSLNATDETVLEPGMVITIEPSMSYLCRDQPDRQLLMVHEENVAVTDDGYELLSRRAPREIPIMGCA